MRSENHRYQCPSCSGTSVQIYVSKAVVDISCADCNRTLVQVMTQPNSFIKLVSFSIGKTLAKSSLLSKVQSIAKNQELMAVGIIMFSMLIEYTCLVLTWLTR